MPELPEVETVRRGIEAPLRNQQISRMIIRDPRLRWPVDDALPAQIASARVSGVSRRAKYLLVETDRGRLMVHLGMSGRLYFVPAGTPPGVHDHIDWELANGQALRYTDPRRFGSVHWLLPESSGHALLDHLGPEPLSEDFTGELLYQRSRKRSSAVKTFIMDGRIVVGVGNIYANEALFKAGIHPKRKAGRISLDRYHKLAEAIRETLSAAILMGGTTLRDFVNSDGKPGYFAQSLLVYGKAGAPCTECNTPLKEIRMNNRSTVYCPRCQR